MIVNTKETIPEKNDYVIKAIAVKKGKCRLNLDKSIYIGTSTLDLKKFQCKILTINMLKINMVIKLKCGQQLLIDTLMYKIETENVYENFYKEKALFNFSNYPKGSKY